MALDSADGHGDAVVVGKAPGDGLRAVIKTSAGHFAAQPQFSSTVDAGRLPELV